MKGNQKILLKNGVKIASFEFGINVFSTSQISLHVQLTFLLRKDKLQVCEGAVLFMYVYPHFNF